MWMMIIIAIHSYIKICHPFYRIRKKPVLVLCSLSLLMTLPFNLPFTFTLYGISRFITTIPGVRSYDCLIAESYRSSVTYRVYNVLLGIAFTTIFTTFLVCYGMIIYRLKKQKARMIVGGALFQGDIPNGEHYQEVGADAITRQRRQNSLRRRKVASFVDIPQISALLCRMAALSERSQPIKLTGSRCCGEAELFDSASGRGQRRKWIALR
ncbi:hypothetical protein ACOMHN_010982 [Nucella lapillus]